MGKRVIRFGKIIMSGIVIIMIVVCLDIIISVVYLNNNITLSHYTVSSGMPESFRVVQMTDLHSKQFGNSNNRIIRTVQEYNPDIIVMTGDMIDKEDKDPFAVFQLIEALSKATPVYFSYGNHEYDWEKKWGKELTPLIEQAGAKVLEQEYVDIVIKGNKIRLGGYYGYYRRPHMVSDEEKYMKQEESFCDNFENTQNYKILLCHIPTMWLDWNCLSDYPVDLVFCGHYHGGIVRIPVINRGLVAPYVGWMPKYTKGIYTGEKTTCVISTGLGNEYRVPRINNPPEIVVVDCDKE